MSKKIFYDIKKNNKIQRIDKQILFQKKKNEDIGLFNKKNKIKRNTISNGAIWLLAVFSIIFLFFTISSFFSNAIINITPNIKEINIDKTFTATKGSKANVLSYNLIILSGEESIEVKAGEEKEYEEYAKGKVIIYNTFSTKPQKLSKDTRLEGSNGKIYKTKTEVIVPGMKENIPGKIEVDIYANEPGSQYNNSPLDFKIFGFKGTSKYNKFYARSVGYINGGIKGKSRQISKEEKEKVFNNLKETLSNKLFQKAKDQIPRDFVLLKDAIYFNTEEEKESDVNNNGNIVFGLKGTFNGIIFNKENLEREIINTSLGKEIDSNIYIIGLEKLFFSKPDKILSTLIDTEDLNFNLSGPIKVVWKIDEDKIKNELIGKNKKDFSYLLESYKNSIDSANLKIKPVWKNFLPDKVDKIKIIVSYPI